MNRATAVLLAALVLVAALTVFSGAEDEPGDKYITRIFDISAISMSDQQRLIEVPRLGLLAVADQLAYDILEDEGMFPIEVVDFAYNETGSTNWSAADGTYITLIGDTRLSVRNTPKLVADVEATLARVTPKKLTRPCKVLIFRFKGDNAQEQGMNFADLTFPALAEATKSLTEAGAERLVSYNTVLKTNRTHVQANLETHRYFKEYYAVVANLSRGFDLETDTFHTGTVVKLKLMDSAGVEKLHIRFDYCELANMETIETLAGPVHIPQLRQFSSRPAEMAVEPQKVFSLAHGFGKESFVMLVETGD